MRVMAGAKATVVATIATTIPTLASVRMLPRARANLNHTAQALIIFHSGGSSIFYSSSQDRFGNCKKELLQPTLQCMNSKWITWMLGSAALRWAMLALTQPWNSSHMYMYVFIIKEGFSFLY